MGFATGKEPDPAGIAGIGMAEPFCIAAVANLKQSISEVSEINRQELHSFRSKVNERQQRKGPFFGGFLPMVWLWAAKWDSAARFPIYSTGKPWLSLRITDKGGEL